MKLPPLLQQRWDAVPRREQRLLLAALAVVLLAVLWWLAFAPALATLKTADRQRGALDAQLQQMLRLQVQAQALQAQPRITLDEARRLLEASVKPMGASAQLVITGERVSVTFKAISADALAQWLTQVRQNVRTAPTQARLVRSATAAAAGASAAATVTWDGTLVLNLNLR
jgi:general secretion pathway protein M